MRSLLFCTLVLTGCDDTIFGQAPGVVDGSDFCAVALSLEEACVICHSAGGQEPDLETDLYLALTTGSSSGRDLVVAGDASASYLYELVAGTGAIIMPPSGVVEGLSDVVGGWIDAGASEVCDGGGGDTAGEEDEEPLTLDYCGFLQIIDEKCLGCHSAEKAPSLGKGLDLETDPQSATVGVMSEVDTTMDIVVANEPENSLLYLKVAGTQDEKTQGDSMPGGSVLDVDEQEVVHQWITDGATTECK